MKAKHAVGLAFRYGEGRYKIVKIRKLPGSSSHIYKVADENNSVFEFHEDGFELMWKDYKAKLLAACGFTLGSIGYMHQPVGPVVSVMDMNSLSDEQFFDLVKKYHNTDRACTNCKSFILTNFKACSTCTEFSNWEEYWI